MIRKYSIALSLLLISLFLGAQTEVEHDSLDQEQVPHWYRSNEIGLNFTPLISSIIPFNLSDLENQPISYRFKSYSRNLAFKLDLGMDLSSFNELDFFHFSIGYERRRQVMGNFYYTSGWMSGFQFIETPDPFNTNSGLLLSHFYGLEYHINDSILISTEANLQFLVGFGAELKFAPPISIFAFVRL